MISYRMISNTSDIIRNPLISDRMISIPDGMISKGMISNDRTMISIDARHVIRRYDIGPFDIKRLVIDITGGLSDIKDV